MHRTHLVAAALVAFVLGCATAAVVVPPATAATSEKYEYWCVSRTAAKPEKLTAQLNEAGQNGWELRTVDNLNAQYTTSATYCFSRRL